MFNLIKEDTSLAFSKNKSAYYPSITTCPTSYDLKGIDTFNDISSVSIRDFIRIYYGNYLNPEKKFVQ